MNLKKVLEAAKTAIIKFFFYTCVTFSIASFVLVLILALTSGFSIATTIGVLHQHPYWVVFAIIISTFITTTLPASITSILIPEATVSKVAGVLGISTSTASLIVLFVMMAFLSGLGILIFSLLGASFMLLALLIRGKVPKAVSRTYRLAAYANIVAGVFFLTTIFTPVWSVSVVAGVIGILIGLILIGLGTYAIFSEKKLATKEVSMAKNKAVV
jgi:hypothetical protein